MKICSMLLRELKVSSEILLVPFDEKLKMDEEKLNEEIEIFYEITRNSKVEEYLPLIYRKSKSESSHVFLKLLRNASETYYIFYSIKKLIGSIYVTIGYIFLAHPALKSATDSNGTPIPGWALTFLLSMSQEGNNIIYSSSSKLLNYLYPFNLKWTD